MPTIDPTFVLLNRVEAGFWTIIAVVMLVVAIRKPGGRRINVVAATAFFLFGLSDLVEATTGAWWRPWWLFVWKAICVLVFLLMLIARARRQSHAQAVNPQTANSEASSPSSRSPEG